MVISYTSKRLTVRALDMSGMAAGARTALRQIAAITPGAMPSGETHEA